MNILETVYFNNTLKIWLASLAAGISLFIIIKIILRFAKYQLNKIC